jgi:hypothetical protein
VVEKQQISIPLNFENDKNIHCRMLIPLVYCMVGILSTFFGRVATSRWKYQVMAASKHLEMGCTVIGMRPFDLSSTPNDPIKRVHKC